MRVAFMLYEGHDGGVVQLFREPGDPKFYGVKHAKGESALLTYLLHWLEQRGFRLIKASTQQDGHMMGDEYQRYLRRPIKCRKSFPDVYIYSGNYALRGANEDWNKDGQVELQLVGNCNGKQSDWQSMIAAMGKHRKFDVVIYKTTDSRKTRWYQQPA